MDYRYLGRSGFRVPALSLGTATFGGVRAAEFERELIRTRTGEGRERAKARGVVLGRKPKLSPHQRREALTRREARRGICPGVSQRFKPRPCRPPPSLRQPKKSSTPTIRRLRSPTMMMMVIRHWLSSSGK
jgi:hypothetical protein